MKKLIILIASLLLTANIFAAKTPIIFATEATYKPFEITLPSGELEGLDIDVIKAICKQMKRQCEFRNQPWESLIPGVKLGKFDAIFGAMNITKEREAQVSFTQPYYKATVSFIMKKVDKFALTPKGMQGKTIGVQRGNTMEYYLRDTYGTKINIKAYASIEQAFLDLKAGRINAVMTDAPVGSAWLNFPSEKAKRQKKFIAVKADIAPKIYEKYFGKGYGIAVNKKNTALLNDLNQAIHTLKSDGQLQKIIESYLN